MKLVNLCMMNIQHGHGHGSNSMRLPCMLLLQIDMVSVRNFSERSYHLPAAAACWHKRRLA